MMPLDFELEYDMKRTLVKAGKYAVYGMACATTTTIYTVHYLSGLLQDLSFDLAKKIKKSIDGEESEATEEIADHQDQKSHNEDLEVPQPDIPESSSSEHQADDEQYHENTCNPAVN